MTLKENQTYEYVNPYTQSKEVLRYTGTRREIKEVMFDFFVNSKNETVFFLPSEVEQYMKEI